MSRTAEPAGLKLLKGRGNGTDSGGRRVLVGPAFRRIAPKPPSWLSAEAKAEWNRVVPGLTQMDLLKPEDRSTLAAYCETWATFVEATRDVRTRGLTLSRSVTSRAGATYEQEFTNPSVTIARNEGKELRAWAVHYGLTPSSESSLAAAADDIARGDDDRNPFSGAEFGGES